MDERDRDAKELASKCGLFFRAIFVPSLAQALEPSRSPAEKQAREDRLRERLARDSIRIDHLVAHRCG